MYGPLLLHVQVCLKLWWSSSGTPQAEGNMHVRIRLPQRSSIVLVVGVCKPVLATPACAGSEMSCVQLGMTSGGAGKNFYVF